jgi:hypothetical protein
MRIYTVHLGPIPEGAPAGAERDMVLVKEGFSWPAFYFSVLWALYHRMWLTAALLFAVAALLGAAVEVLDPARQAAVSLGFSALVGSFANDWRRAALASRGFEETGVVAARGLEAAEHRVLDRLGDRLGAAGLR